MDNTNRGNGGKPDDTRGSYLVEWAGHFQVALDQWERTHPALSRMMRMPPSETADAEFGDIGFEGNQKRFIAYAAHHIKGNVTTWTETFLPWSELKKRIDAKWQVIEEEYATEESE
jgi:hypothetical protein